jgi:cyclic pyranopterin phosphate synthase
MTDVLTHLDAQGRARMVDVGAKETTARRALACGEIRMKPAVLRRLLRGETAKGDAIAVANIAGVLAAKRVDELIPLCHGLNLDSVRLTFTSKRDRLRVTAETRVRGRTGVEMEALTAVSVACLTIYDMAKAADRAMTIGSIQLLEKEGGRSGRYVRAKRGAA